jgi:hypothetical protein
LVIEFVTASCIVIGNNVIDSVQIGTRVNPFGGASHFLIPTAPVPNLGAQQGL